MCENCEYNPEPTRVWSRVQYACTDVPNINIDYSVRYVPLLNKVVSSQEAYELDKLYAKGNVLQYKKNSYQMTKSEKYSQLARGMGPSRKRSYASQTETVTNPNTTGMTRAGYLVYPFPNDIIGAPNNPSGPFAYGVPNPYGCTGDEIIDGGVLVCGSYSNPCTGEVVTNSNRVYAITNGNIFSSASASNVPGGGVLCWNTKLQSWYPKQRYTMNNSTSKWPVNYKFFKSALKCNSSN